MCLKVVSEAFVRGHRQRSRFRIYAQKENKVHSFIPSTLSATCRGTVLGTKDIRGKMWRNNSVLLQLYSKESG